MTEQENSAQTQEQKVSDKEINFRKQEQMYQRKLAEMEAKMQEMQNQMRSQPQVQEDDDSDDPYVDHKKLEKKLSSFERKIEEKIDKKSEEKARSMVERERREMWIKQNPDFYEVLQNNAEKFAQHDPELAETILQMPEGFERQKLVYKNIKALGLDKPESKKPSIQEKIDANRRSPYYQPSGVGNAPYGMAGDFTPGGQKNAYDKMQELKNRLRLG